MRENFREIYQFTELGECVLAGRSTLPEIKTQQRLAWVLLAAGGAVLALGLGGGWWLTGRAIRPVQDISAAAMRISAGNLSERITTADPQDEFGRLAAVLNSTFGRLESAFLRQKQFTADASHELRTPLAVLICEAQATLARERTSAEYRETIEANLAAAQQMRQLTESLLTLARLESGHENARREPFDLGELTQSCIDRIRPLAGERQITIRCDFAAAGCHGDDAQIRQVITNLLANAIHYNRDGGEVHVSTRVEGESAVLTVRDTGPGISASDLPHIFDRFYRADKARSGAEGHSGLGLAISKAIVEAHGGTVRAESEPGVGTTFTVRFPKSAA
jgi:heavy metal sensor kinase